MERAGNSINVDMLRLELEFAWDAATQPRVECPECGRPDALGGWPHRNAERGPCMGVRTDPTKKATTDWIDRLWPNG